MSILSRENRKGTTAVEFAVVAPVILLFVFSLIELSKLMLFEGKVTSATLVGLREATLVDATPSGVVRVVLNELAQSGITDVSIQITPQNFDSKVQTLGIRLDVPLSRANGFNIGHLIVGNSVVRKSIQFDRE